MIELNAEAVARYNAAKSTASKETGRDSLIMVYAPAGAGKSTALLTASKLFKGLPNKSEKIFCKDLGIIQTDPAGSEGYKSAGYDCEIITYRDILKGCPEKGIEPIVGGRPRDAMLMSLALAATYKDVGRWGLDTITFFDKDERAWLDVNPLEYTSKKSGNVDTMLKWDLLADSHKQVYNAYMALPGVKLVTAHAKAKLDDLFLRDNDKTGAEMQERKQKGVIGGDPALYPDLTGRAKDYWIAAASLVVFIKVKDPGGGKPLTRTLETEYNATTDAAVKSRFSFLFDKSLPFDMNQVIETIRK